MSRNVKTLDNMYLDMMRMNPMARKAKKTTGTQRGDGLGFGFGGGMYRFRFDFDLGKVTSILTWDAPF